MPDEVTTAQQVVLLEEQLRLARQKASLYYIAVSELESLKLERNPESFLKRVDVATCTRSDSCILDKSCQTESSSSGLEKDQEIQELKEDVAKLGNQLLANARTEKSRIILEARFRFLIQNGTNSNENEKAQSLLILSEYGEMFEELLRQNKESINHSVEIKRRDHIIASLFDKIRLMESAFSLKLMHTEEVASSRLAVIQEMGNQLRAALQTSNHCPETLFDSRMQSEIEDLKAELSKARSNWAATRDELMRLQFRVGIDGNGGDLCVANDGFPSPIFSLGEQAKDGMLSGIRNIRKRQD